MANDLKQHERDEEQRQVAVQIALRTGLLRKCPQHGESYDSGQHDYQGACMVATYLINNGDPLVAPFLGDRSRLIELLKTICQSYGKTCPQCANAPPLG